MTVVSGPVETHLSAASSQIEALAAAGTAPALVSILLSLAAAIADRHTTTTTTT